MYTLEIDENSHLITAILHDDLPFLILVNTMINQRNAYLVVNALNKSETNYKRKYVTEDGTQYYELNDNTVICNGVKIDKLFNDIIGSEYSKIDDGLMKLGKFV